MKLFIIIIVFSFFNFFILANPKPKFKVVHSISFELPFWSYEKPALNFQIKGDTIFMLNFYGAELYMLNSKGSVIKNIIFEKIIDKKFQYAPITFYIGKKYYLFGETRILVLDKDFKFRGLFFLGVSVKNHYFDYDSKSLFFSESNQQIYYTSGANNDDTDSIQSLTYKYYNFEKCLATFKIPFSFNSDSSKLEKIFEGNYMILRSNIFRSKNGFLPYMDFRNVLYDDSKNQIVISEAPDSLIYTFDLRGNLLGSFGRKGSYIKNKDSLRFIKSFNINLYKKNRRVYRFLLDSIKYHCAYYYQIRSNPELQLLARTYVVPDSLKLVSGSEVQYSSFEFWKSSFIKTSMFIQVYDHQKLIQDLKIPDKWNFIGFSRKNLVFYKLDNIKNTYRYKVHLYYVSFI